MCAHGSYLFCWRWRGHRVHHRHRRAADAEGNCASGYWNTREKAIPTSANDTQGLKRSPTLANFQKMPRNLQQAD